MTVNPRLAKATFRSFLELRKNSYENTKYETVFVIRIFVQIRNPME